MSSRLPKDEALEKEDRIDEMTKKKEEKKKPTRPAHAAITAGSRPTICILIGRPGTRGYPVQSPDPTLCFYC